MFNEFYKGKKVLVTGNTGFKGSWLTAWLLMMESKVYGLSIDIPTEPSMYEILGLEKKIKHYFGDINDLNIVEKIIKEVKPDVLFHLAAQPLVRLSYDEPNLTLKTNALGTANILEGLRKMDTNCLAVFITSDKAYDNVEWTWGYRENDPLGGKDPYSASKGMAELAIRSYYKSFFSHADSKIRLAVGRAGNVIGGGDWAKDRIVPDAMRSWAKGEILNIRSPNATRPWQHVLEPLSGYLQLGWMLNSKNYLNGEAFNFGPPGDQNYTVSNLLDLMKRDWPGASWKTEELETERGYREAGLLKLNTDKALHQLDWMPVLNFEETGAMTSEWYYNYYKENTDSWEYTSHQIDRYSQQGLRRNLQWAK